MGACCTKVKQEVNLHPVDDVGVGAPQSPNEGGLSHGVDLASLEVKPGEKGSAKEEANNVELKTKTAEDRDQGMNNNASKRDHHREESFEKIRRWIAKANSSDLASLSVHPNDIRNMEDVVFDEKAGAAPPTDADRYPPLVR